MITPSVHDSAIIVGPPLATHGDLSARGRGDTFEVPFGLLINFPSEDQNPGWERDL